MVISFGASSWMSFAIPTRDLRAERDNALVSADGEEAMEPMVAALNLSDQGAANTAALWYERR